MKMLKTISTASLIAMASPAFAQMSAEEVINVLKEQGYTNIEVRKTILGRIKIEAIKDGIEREIVVTKNGRVLRDEQEEAHEDREDEDEDDHEDDEDDDGHDDDHDDDEDEDEDEDEDDRDDDDDDDKDDDDKDDDRDEDEDDN